MSLFAPESKSIPQRLEAEGSQSKFQLDGYWYKLNCLGNEAFSEIISSVILKNSHLPENIQFVEYTPCIVDGKRGCKSKNFLKEGEEFISFQRLFRNTTGKELSEEIFTKGTVKDRFDFLVDYAKIITNLDISDYLKCNLTLDALIKNPDRHFGNLGFIVNEYEQFRLAPIFDNGQGLGQNYQITPPILEYDEKIEKLYAATLSGSFDLPLREIGIGFTIDYDSLREDLDAYIANHPLVPTEKDAMAFLDNQLKQYQAILEETKEYEHDEF